MRPGPGGSRAPGGFFESVRRADRFGALPLYLLGNARTRSNPAGVAFLYIHVVAPRRLSMPRTALRRHYSTTVSPAWTIRKDSAATNCTRRRFRNHDRDALPCFDGKARIQSKCWNRLLPDPQAVWHKVSMANISYRLRVATIALAAIMPALLLTGRARAACIEMTDAATCSGGCACCESQGLSDVAAKYADVVAATAQKSPQIGHVARTAAARGCVCRTGTPAAPEPKGNRTETSRHDVGRQWTDGSLVFDDPAHAVLAPSASTAAQPAFSHLYLRNSRLLI